MYNNHKNKYNIKLTELLPPPNFGKIMKQPNINIPSILGQRIPPDSGIIAHDIINKSLANKLIQKPYLIEDLKLIVAVKKELQSLSMKELYWLFQEWGIPTDDIRGKDNYISRFFEYVESLLPVGSPQKELNLLLPPLLPYYDYRKDYY